MVLLSSSLEFSWRTLWMCVNEQAVSFELHARKLIGNLWAAHGQGRDFTISILIWASFLALFHIQMSPLLHPHKPFLYHTVLIFFFSFLYSVDFNKPPYVFLSRIGANWNTNEYIQDRSVRSLCIESDKIQPTLKWLKQQRKFVDSRRDKSRDFGWSLLQKFKLYNPEPDYFVSHFLCLPQLSFMLRPHKKGPWSFRPPFLLTEAKCNHISKAPNPLHLQEEGSFLIIASIG